MHPPFFTIDNTSYNSYNYNRYFLNKGADL